MNYNQVPRQTSKQAKYSSQYRVMIDKYKEIQKAYGLNSIQEERAYKRLLQAKDILNEAHK